MGEIWVRIDMSNGESYIGSIKGPYDIDSQEEFLLFLEEQAYMGLKLDNVHRCEGSDSDIKLTPLDNEESIYKSSMVIMNIDSIVTIKFLKEDSEIVKNLKKKLDKQEEEPVKNAKNVLNFRLTKKEFV